MKLVDVLNLKTIGGQITALVIASIVAIHLILTVIFLIGRPDQEPPDPSIDRGHAQFAAAVQLLGAAAPADRPRLMSDLARAFPKLDIEPLPPGPIPPEAGAWLRCPERPGPAGARTNDRRDACLQPHPDGDLPALVAVPRSDCGGAMAADQAAVGTGTPVRTPTSREGA